MDKTILMAKMLITIDVGNSSINIGYFIVSGLMVQKITSHPLRTVDEYRKIISEFLEQNHLEKTIFSCIISSVVTSHTAVLRDAAEKLSENTDNNVVILSHQMDTGLNLKIKSPES